MNVTDIKGDIKVPETRAALWAEIFSKQRQLIDQYSGVEGMGNLLETTDTNLNTANGQKWIKDFAWRTTEELAEAWEAIMDEDKEHIGDEFADALHFLTELTIIAGYDYTIIPEVNLVLHGSNPWFPIYHLGMTCNTLKNKPWKQHQLLTDEREFKKRLIETWKSFILYAVQNLESEENLFIYYFKKHAINEFRQRSNY